jgi:antitoxin component YwqK of YwqJK toxin-antitoxin module
MLVAQEKTYHKIYDDNGVLKEEGWKQFDLKTAYWKFYYAKGGIASKGHFKNNVPDSYWYFYNENGNLEKEGHFKFGLKQKWWIIYDEDGKISRKEQFKNDQIDGYCFQYKKGKILKIEKYLQNIKIKEWTDLKKFEAENNLKDLM